MLGPLELLSVILISSLFDLLDEEDDDNGLSCVGCLIELLLVDSLMRTVDSVMLLVGGDAPRLIVSVPEEN